jgi:hypothetical protein
MSKHHDSFSPIFQNGTQYLAFLHLYGDDLGEAFNFIKNACENSANPVGEIRSLLSGPGWREHLLAAGTLLARKDLAPAAIGDLWRAFDRGSWVSPQLAVTAWFRDPQFTTNANMRILRRCELQIEQVDDSPAMVRHVVYGPGGGRERAAKGFSALIYLIGPETPHNSFLLEQLQMPDVKELLTSDIDNGGKIAQNWIDSLTAKAPIFGLDLKRCE